MSSSPFPNLSRRERQIMDAVYTLGEASAAEIHAQISQPITDASVRRLLRILETKGHLTHSKRGREYLYRPVAAREEVRRAAVRHMVTTLFRGSVSDAVSALLNASQGELTEEEAAELRRLIDQAEAEGR